MAQDIARAFPAMLELAAPGTVIGLFIGVVPDVTGRGLIDTKRTDTQRR